MHFTNAQAGLLHYQVALLWRWANQSLAPLASTVGHGLLIELWWNTHAAGLHSSAMH